MAGQVLKTKSKIREPLFQGSRRRHGDTFHSPPIPLQLELAPRLGAGLPFSLGFSDRFLSGLTSATTVPTEIPSSIARPSLRARTFTSCFSKLRPRSQ